jgi:uncharacterized coiled-coil DUF342 family protein
VIESLDADTNQSANQRPKTAKPTSTDVTNLKLAAEELSREINEKKEGVQELSQLIEIFYKEHKEENERFYALQTEFESSKARMEEEHKELQQVLNLFSFTPLRS